MHKAVCRVKARARTLKRSDSDTELLLSNSFEKSMTPNASCESTDGEVSELDEVVEQSTKQEELQFLPRYPQISGQGSSTYSDLQTPQSRSGKGKRNCPPPVPPRKSILQVEREIKQLQEEIEKLNLNVEDVAVKEELDQMQMSLCGLRRLRLALLETQKDVIGTRGCIGEPWFKPYWERTTSEMVLRCLLPGSFVICRSPSSSSSLSLSMRSPSGPVEHYPILESGLGTDYCLKGAEHAHFRELIDLVNHLSCNTEVLPCCLFRPDYKPQ